MAFGSDGKSKSNLMATGSRDGLVKLWSVSGANEVDLVHACRDHEGYVNAVTVLPPSDVHPAGLVVSGGADSMVRMLDVGSRLVTGVLAGHTGNVAALGHFGAEVVISGSWDSTAIVWDGRTGARLFTLRGHTNAVWAVLALSATDFVTASADKTIKVWQGDRCVRTLTGHADCPRALGVLRPGVLVSAGNDNAVRTWDLATGAMTGAWEDAHSAYIYSLALLENGLLATAGEDRCIRLWDAQARQCVQSIAVPATSVWALAPIPDCDDLVCGTSDGHVYVYTSEPARQLFDEALLEVYEEKLRQAIISRQTIDSSAVSSRDRLGAPGSTPGEHIIVEGNGRVEAYQWDGLQWTKIGDVVDSSGASVRQEFEGQLYDHVFDVQVEDGAAAYKLPYNLDDNPYAAAQKFAARHSLPPSYVDQIVEFILKNTGQGGAAPKQPELFNPYQTPASASAPAPAQPASGLLGEPVRLAAANLDGIAKKIAEFNTVEGAAIDGSRIDALVAYLKKATRAVPAGLQATFEALAAWPADRLFPVLDLARIVALEEQLAPSVASFVALLCLHPIPVAADPKAASANVTMHLRLLTNAFQSKALWQSVVKPNELLLAKTVRSLMAVPQKEPALPYQCLFNFCVGVSKDAEPGDDFCKYLLALLLEKARALGQQPGGDDLPVRLLLSAICAVKAKLPKAQVRSLLNEVAVFQSHPAGGALVGLLTQ